MLSGQPKFDLSRKKMEAEIYMLYKKIIFISDSACKTNNDPIYYVKQRVEFSFHWYKIIHFQ